LEVQGEAALVGAVKREDVEEEEWVADLKLVQEDPAIVQIVATPHLIQWVLLATGNFVQNVEAE
jgi:hypothetical protein